MINDLPFVTTTERSTFRRCSFRWHLRFRLGLTPKTETADALWFGTGVHIALAEWYKKGLRRGPHPAKTFSEWCGDEIREIRANVTDDWYEEPKYEDARELGVAMLENYVDYYGKDPDWEILAIEHPFKVKVMRKGVPIAIFMSTWDGVFRDKTDGRVYLLEHKTAGQISTAYLELDDQGGVYYAVADSVLRANGTLQPTEHIAGVMYNFLRKTSGDDRPENEEGLKVNQDGRVSKRQPPPAFVRQIVERSPSESKTQLERLADEVTIMNAMREGSLPIIKNTTKDCTFCEYFDMCKLHERGGVAWQTLAHSLYTTSDPYARYIKSAGG